MGNKPTQEDIAAPIHHAIDWSKCVGVGSYPLQQYMNASWIPDDIDFACKANTPEEFNKIVEKFAQEAGQKGFVQKWAIKPDGLEIKGSEDYCRDRLGDYFVASCNIKIDGVKQPIQFIGLKAEPNDDLPSIINKVADLPACISYSMSNGNRIFHVPYRAINVLRTMRVSARDIAFARQEKYRKRGFKIVE